MWRQGSSGPNVNWLQLRIGGHLSSPYACFTVTYSHMQSLTIVQLCSKHGFKLAGLCFEFDILLVLQD